MESAAEPEPTEAASRTLACAAAGFAATHDRVGAATRDRDDEGRS